MMKFKSLGVVCAAGILASSSAGCASTAQTEDEITSDSEDELSENHRPTVEVRIGSGHRVGAHVCASRTLRLAYRLHSELLYANTVEFYLLDQTSGQKLPLKTFALPKHTSINEDAGYQGLNLEEYLGDLTKYDGHRMRVVVKQRRSNGKWLADAHAAFFVITAPKVDLVSVERSESCPTSGPVGCLAAPLTIYPTHKYFGAHPWDYVCDELGLQLKPAMAKASIAPFALVHGASQVAPTTQNSYWASPHNAPTQAALVYRGQAISGFVAIK